MNQHPQPPRNEAGIATAISVLRQRFGARLQTGAAIREQHGHTTTWIPNQAPDAVVMPGSTEEVAEVVRICADHCAPVIPFGTGTSLEGHVNAPAGGISVDMMGMDRVLEVNAADLDVRVQPGVTREALNTHLRDAGLFFPIDPGANASLGGMAATRASGTNAVRYGTMRENVLALEAVMADGQVIRTARRARKTSAGYDLTRLLVGSEGTLGLITEITLRLHPIPEAVQAARMSFPSVAAACEAVMAVIGYGIPLARIELMDRACVGAANAYGALGLPDAPLLLLEFHGSAAGVAEQIAVFQELASEAGGHAFQTAETAEQRNRMWKGRHDMYYALMRLRPGAKAIATDSCVPISRLAEAVAGAQRKAAELDLVSPILGHVGDGNFHCTVLVDMDDQAEERRARAFTGWLAGDAIRLDGTCTGEHGIGQGKIPYLRKELGAATEVMAAIKRALDPQGILNPGKII